jgi:hypothetical protein
MRRMRRPQGSALSRPALCAAALLIAAGCGGEPNAVATAPPASGPGGAPPRPTLIGPAQPTAPPATLSGITSALSVDFSSDSGPFETFDVDSAAARVAEGVLQLTFEEGSQISVVPAVGLPFGDASVQVDARDAGPLAAGRFGIFCRLPDQGRYVEGAIDTAGDAGMRIASYGGGGSQPLVMAPADAVRAGLRAVNRLRLDCIGPTFTLWVNDHLVGALSDTGITTGEAGVFASSADADGHTEVDFDDFEVLQPSS